MIFAPDCLRGKTILVSGATGGCGSTTAKLIARCGGKVVCLGRDPERTTMLANSLHGGGHSARWDEHLDITGDWPQVDGVFHAAGAEHVSPASMMNSEVNQRVMGPSVNMALDIMKLIASRKSPLVKDGGTVVLMSSVAAARGASGMTLYAASKGAIESLTLSAAMEFAPRRIRVNAIRAGAFESPMHTRIMGRTTQNGADEYAARHPLGFGRAEDVANMAVFLLTDAAKWCTGAIYTCDGGFTAR